MKYPAGNFKAIDDFFDAYSLAHARYMLAELIQSADAERVWKGKCPANAVYFTQKLQELVAAVFAIMDEGQYPDEIVLDKNSSDQLWMLKNYAVYCGWHRASTPWDFFPRHLTQKEFLNPFRALKKFTRYRSLPAWSDALKELAHHSLSPESIREFEDGTRLLGTWLHLHKLLDAAHLLEVRRKTEEGKTPRKWNNHKNNRDSLPDVKKLSLQHIREFFAFFGEDGAQEDLWKMLKLALANENDATEARNRSNMIFLFEQVAELLDDVYELHLKED